MHGISWAFKEGKEKAIRNSGKIIFPKKSVLPAPVDLKRVDDICEAKV